jgi:hypothetical protein
LQALKFPIHLDPASKDCFLEPEQVSKLSPAKLTGLFGQSVPVAVASDAHLYGISENPHLLHEIYAEAIRRKVLVMFNSGDIGQGWHYKGAKKDLLITPLADDGTRYIVQHWPRVPKRIEVDPSLDPNDPANHQPLFYEEVISGDHDYKTSYEAIGHDMVAYAALQLGPSFRYHGYPSAIVVSKEAAPLVAKLFHPMGGPGYARTYKAQGELYALISRIGEEVDEALKELASEDKDAPQKVHVIFIGHYHVAVYMIYKGIHVFCVPALQSKTDDYMERKSLEPDIGAWFPTFTFDKDGNITESRAEYLDLRAGAASLRACKKRRHYEDRERYFADTKKRLSQYATYKGS